MRIAVMRDFADAFVVATAAALGIDTVLRLALEAARVSGGGGDAPWWITANVIERGRWVALAVLLRVAAPRLLAPTAEQVPGRGAGGDERAGAWRAIGWSVIALPLAWILATWIVSAVRFTLLGSWSTEGQVFLAVGYYRGLAMDYVPWLMAGAAVLGVRRHL